MLSSHVLILSDVCCRRLAERSRARWNRHSAPQLQVTPGVNNFCKGLSGLLIELKRVSHITSYRHYVHHVRSMCAGYEREAKERKKLFNELQTLRVREDMKLSQEAYLDRNSQLNFVLKM